MLSALVAAMALTYVAAECPNACSSHGRCGDYDSCECYRNWMSSDCSERVCQFGLAHVDTPKGDLDSSKGALAGPGSTVISGNDIYPSGTTEQFPAMVDSAGATLTNTAHGYMECSNKGICDREAGECQCFDGYEGSACQRASCPSSKAGVCSGHGTCRTIAALAESDYNNHYKLWDADITLGCECDAGYFGAACSQRKCKYGFDPLFHDEENTKRFANWKFGISAIGGAGSDASNGDGTFSLIFYDAHGEDWETMPIDWKTWNADAAHADGICTAVVKALGELPNDVIPRWSTGAPAINCQGVAIPTGSDLLVGFSLGFPMNPGNLRQPSINIYNDGLRPSLWTDDAGDTIKTFVFADGFAGEDVDFVPDFCEGVSAKINSAATAGTAGAFVTADLDGLSTLAFESAGMDKIFKTCLGESDARANTVANDIQQWDYGTVENPHLIKLVPKAAGTAGHPTADLLGTYVVIIYDVGWDVFVVYNNIVGDTEYTGNYFNVFTTTGTLQVISSYAQVATYDILDASNAAAAAKSSQYSNVLYTFVDTTHIDHSSVTGTNEVQYDFSCEASRDTSGDFFRQFGDDTATDGALLQLQLECLERDDYLMAFSCYSANAITVGYSNRVETTSSGGAGVNFMLEGETWPDDTGATWNPKYFNIYQVKKIGREDNYADSVTETALGRRNQIHLDKGFNHAYAASNSNALDNEVLGNAKLYKFTPPMNKIQNTYAAECSTRGVCNRDTGLCSCFAGYTNDNCDRQDALAE